MCGCRTAYADSRQCGTGQGIEDRGLPGAGRAGEGDNGGASGYGKPPVSLINDASGLGQSIGINSALAQLDSFAQGTKMINQMLAGILAAKHPKTPAGHYRSSSRGWSTSSPSTISLSLAASPLGIWLTVGASIASRRSPGGNAGSATSLTGRPPSRADSTAAAAARSRSECSESTASPSKILCCGAGSCASSG